MIPCLPDWLVLAFAAIGFAVCFLVVVVILLFALAALAARKMNDKLEQDRLIDSMMKTQLAPKSPAVDRPAPASTTIPAPTPVPPSP